MDMIKFYNKLPQSKLNFDLIHEGCKKGNLDIVRTLLTDPNLLKHADIHFDDDEPLFMAAMYHNKNPKILQFLVESPELSEHANIYARDGAILFELRHNLDMLKYFILEQKMKIDDNMLNKILASTNSKNATELIHIIEFLELSKIEHESKNRNTKLKL